MPCLKRLKILLAALCCAALLRPAPGQTDSLPVYVSASFLGKNGIFIEDLSPEEVQIFENDQPRKIEFMARDQTPTIYGLLFDRSMLPESVEYRRNPDPMNISAATLAKSMAYELIDKHIGRQELWIASYDREFKLELDVTSDGFKADEVIQRLRGPRQPEDSFLYAALFSGLMKMSGRNERRRVIIVFLETLDRETFAKARPMANLLSYSNVELFVVSLDLRPGIGRLVPPIITRRSLGELARSTAGEAFLASDYRDNLDKITRELLHQLRALYTFGFESQVSPDQRAKLTIKCLRPGSKVRARPVVPAAY